MFRFPGKLDSVHCILHFSLYTNLHEFVLKHISFLQTALIWLLCHIIVLCFYATFCLGSIRFEQRNQCGQFVLFTVINAPKIDANSLL